MKHIIAFFLVVSAPARAAFTEFYVQTTGSNLNAGSTTSDSASVTSANGDWANAAADTFTATSGTPFSGVTAGEYASVFLDGSTQTGYVAQVVSVGGSGASVTLSTTIKAGTAPAAGATGRTCKIGGAWAGPSGAVDFPFGFIASTLSSSSTTPTRSNWKNGTWTVTDGIVHTTDDLWWEAYTTTPGDNTGWAVIQGPTTGTAFTLITASSMDRSTMEGFIVENNGNSGTDLANYYLMRVGNHNLLRRCKFRNGWGNGVYNSQESAFVEIEAYNNCLGGGAATQAGIKINYSGALALRCVSHDNARGGFLADGGILLHRVITYDNGGAGMGSTGDENQFCMASDFYGNTNSGAHLGLGSQATMNVNYWNVNFIKNTRYGFESEGQATPGTFFHNAFGSGTMVNSLGTVDNDKWRQELNTLTYGTDVSPYSDAANGNFNITGSAANESGYSVFLQLHPSYSGTVGYIDRGAAHQ